MLLLLRIPFDSLMGNFAVAVAVAVAVVDTFRMGGDHESYKAL